MDNENMIMDDEFSNIITLTDADGEAVNFEFLDLIAYEGEEYVVLLPTEDDDEEDDGEVVILCVQENGDDEEYTAVEDEETLQAVFEIFKDKFKDEFNFMD